MRTAALALFANSLFSKPCCCDVAALRIAGAHGITFRQWSSATETADTPSNDADNAPVSRATDQQTRPRTKQTATLAHADTMRKLRRRWQAEHKQKLARKAEADAIKNATKAASEEAHRAKRAQMKDLRIQIHEEKRRLQASELAQRQALAAEFRAATQGIYKEIQARRRADLLEQSKDWITPETLDARIEEALENPIELYEEVAESTWHYKE